MINLTRKINILPSFLENFDVDALFSFLVLCWGRREWVGRVRPRFYVEAKKHEETVSSYTKIYIGQIRKNVFHGGQTMEGAVQGNDGALIPGGIYEICGCGTKGHCLIKGLSRSGWYLDLVTLKLFSNLDDSLILWFCVNAEVTHKQGPVSRLAGSLYFRRKRQQDGWGEWNVENVCSEKISNDPWEDIHLCLTWLRKRRKKRNLSKHIHCEQPSRTEFHSQFHSLGASLSLAHPRMPAALWPQPDLWLLCPPASLGEQRGDDGSYLQSGQRTPHTVSGSLKPQGHTTSFFPKLQIPRGLITKKIQSKICRNFLQSFPFICISRRSVSRLLA